MKYRTHTCNQLTKADVGNKVILSGWNSTRRDHGGLIFIDLRDRYGLTQVSFDPTKNKDAHATAEKLSREDVITIQGTVQPRPDGMTNKNLQTGEIEVIAEKLEIFSKATTPPIEVDDRVIANEETRLKYRYLDLRRPTMIKNLAFRDKCAIAARSFFHQNDFLEIETPLLVRATPEGARDYVVPSRTVPGTFFALPQSPQLYKQILMVAGMDKYFQFARCLRDEDLRSDRQPEHTQMDLEMSFVTAEDIMEFVEGLFKHITKEAAGIEIKEPFVKLTYDESMKLYGTDKPDLRFKLELTDVTDIVKDSDFQVFQNVAKDGGLIKCINPEQDLPRKEVDALIDFCTQAGAKGMAWMRVTKDGLESNIAKFFDKETQTKLIEATQAKEGSMLMFIADKPATTNAVLAALRNHLGEKLSLIAPNQFSYCWVTDFPLFEFNEEENKWDACHHIFSSPKKEHIKHLETDPGKVYGDLFDIVLNGTEMGSGSIRISQPALQKQIMKVIGFDEKEAEHKFGFLLNAYKYGGPPHGGMGLGFDRLVAMLLGYTDIREVITFPKNKNAENPMDGCPSNITEQQAKELYLKSTVAKK
jgi:aspartyl-tRNA synthetase